MNGITQYMSEWLSSFTQPNVFKFHPCYSIYQYFILWLHNTPLCGYTTFVYSFSSSVEEHLGCLRLLAIVNSAVMDIVFKFLYGHLYLFLLGIYLGVELLDHAVTLCLTLWELPDCFPKWLHYFTFPSAVHESSNFFISLSTFVVVIFLSVLVFFI